MQFHSIYVQDFSLLARVAEKIKGQGGKEGKGG